MSYNKVVISISYQGKAVFHYSVVVTYYSVVMCRDLYNTWHQEHQTSVLVIFLTRVVFKVCTCMSACNGAFDFFFFTL